MPGFRHCSWCQGKGCMCCDAEQARWDRAEAERRVAEEVARAKRIEETVVRRAAQRADPAFQDWAIDRVRPEEIRPFLRERGGFRYCPRCDGGGCEACPGSEREYLLRAVADAIWWKQDRPDVRDLRDAVVRTEAARREAGDDGSLSADQVEAAFQPALDAEYARQFPDGPKPIFTARLDNSEDVRLLKHVAHVDVLRSAFGPGGDGVAEIERRAAVAREVQATLQSRSTE